MDYSDDKPALPATSFAAAGFSWNPPKWGGPLAWPLAWSRCFCVKRLPTRSWWWPIAGQLGLALFLDGCCQVTGFDPAAYHEMLAHVPLLTHPKPERVLIIGGGDGGTLSEVVKHREVELAEMCEIDVEVVEAAKEFFPELAKGFAHPKARLHIGDGFEFVARKENGYDVILVDSSDPEGPAARLFGRKFYQSLRRALRPGGILAAQAESFHFYLPLLKHIFSFSRPMFPVCRYYQTLVPSYTGGHIGFSFLSLGPDPQAPVEPARLNALGRLDYYTPQIHRAAFALPAKIERALAE